MKNQTEPRLSLTIVLNWQKSVVHVEGVHLSLTYNAFEVFFPTDRAFGCDPVLYEFSLN